MIGSSLFCLHLPSRLLASLPPPCIWLPQKQSMLCRFGSYKVCHRALYHHKQRPPHGRRQRWQHTTCKKSATEEAPQLHKAVPYPSNGERSGLMKSLHANERVMSRIILADEEIYISTAHYVENTGVALYEPQDCHSQLSQDSGLHAPLCLNSIARHHKERLMYSISITQSPQKEEMAALKWVKNLGSVYGASLMLLVGLGYWIQGFRYFPWFTVNFYLKDVLIVDPGTLQIVQNTNLPMVAKPMYGIVSDTVYIRGAHRVPYLVIGGFLQALSWGTIAFLPGGGSSVSIICILLGLSNLGASMVDVANDALVAEYAKKEKSNRELQSFAWFLTAVGGILGNLVAASG